jgi:3-deoxy-7-phosphoheptulonate synthase
MVIVLRESAQPSERAELARLLIESGATHVPESVRCLAGDVICIQERTLPMDVQRRIEAASAVKQLLSISIPYPLASRALSPTKTVVRVGSVRIGGTEPVVIAGPCSVESRAQIFEAARTARDAGALLLRGGAFKPRTSPYSFQGLGMQGVELLAEAGAATGLPVVTEVMEPGLVAEVAQLADVLQVGSRNMQNYPLLRAVGRSTRPVLLKRGFAATLDEWLLAAEYILAEGNPKVILCERGVRSFDQQTRNLLDLTCVPLLGELTHLPVLVDPSHATGRRELVAPMGVAAIAAGADGLLVEMHPHPDQALSDGEQTIAPSTLRQLVERCRAVRGVLSAPESTDAIGDDALASGALEAALGTADI